MSHAGLMTQDARLARRNVARAVIIEAGRRLALRDGVDELSLSAVAAEAGFNSSTVFGHFRNKDELLLAIVAEDLGALAGLMRASTMNTRFSELIPTSDSSEAAPPGNVVPEETRYSSAGAEVASRPEAGRGPNDEASADSGSPERPPVDLWLERRLRIFERSLSDLEHRLKEAEEAAMRAMVLSEETAKTLFGRIEALEREQRETAQSLTARMEETERRQRGATAEMRAAVNDAATRIEILEAARRVDQSAARTTEGPPVQSSAPGQPLTRSPEHPDEDTDQERYFAAAQRAASAAALLAGMQERAEKAKLSENAFRPRLRLQRRHYVLAACLVFVAFAVGAFVAFYVGEARGRQVAATSHRVQAAQLSQPATATRSPGKAHPASATVVSADPRVRLAALSRAGSANAQLLLGLQFLHGDGVDRAEGARWLRLAAEQHNPVAEYYLGSLYEHGDGVPRDNTEAIRWYETAARQGNRKAMHALGIAYAQGEGAKKDYSEAARWFSEAAELGLVNSQFNLAVLYERGLGVRQSLLEAYKWYAVAAASGDQESRKRLDALKTQLSADDLTAGERAAWGFTPKKDDPATNNPPVLADLLSH
jgi:TPR repeat protein